VLPEGPESAWANVIEQAVSFAGPGDAVQLPPLLGENVEKRIWARSRVHGPPVAQANRESQLPQAKARLTSAPAPRALRSSAQVTSFEAAVKARNQA
jgi:hypothetical protein